MALACPPPAQVVTVAAHRVVVERPCTPKPRVPGVSVRSGELWFRGIRLTRRLPNSDGLEPYPEPVSASPDGRWVAWFAAEHSGSITADGLRLYVTRLARGGRTIRVSRSMLTYPDYLTWCGSKVVFTDGGIREATWKNKQLLAAEPPDWKPRSLWRAPGRTFGSVTCAPNGHSVAVLSQRASRSSNFFGTRWQLWRVGLDGRHRLLDQPPPGWADESPRFARDGTVFFVRERQGRGTVHRLGGGPVVSLGYSMGYYGHHDWPYRVS